MSSIKKAGMLIALLASPVFLFLFLKTCGTNHYDLPYFHPLPAFQQTGVDTVYYQVDSSLGLKKNGDTLRPKDLQGQLVVFLTHLPDSVRGEKLKLAKDRLVNQLGRSGEVIFVEENNNSIEENSTEESESDGWLQVTVPKIDETAQTGWGQILKLEENSRTFSTQTNLILMDGNRHIRGYYNIFDPDDFDRTLAEVKVLLHQRNLTARQ